MHSILTNAKMTVVQPSGHFNASNAVALRQQLMEAVSSRQSPNLLVDMSKVESLDSAGLMALVSALNLAQGLEQRFSLCSVAPSIRIIFELTQLDQVFEMFKDQAAFEKAIA